MVGFEAQLTGASLRKLVAWAAAGMMLAPIANAEVAVGVSAGVSRSDNIQRVERGEEDESVGSVNVNFDLEEKASRSRAKLVGDLSYLSYFDGAFGDDLVGKVGGDAAITLFSDRLELFVSDTFGQEAVQSFSAVTPDNRENVNVLSFGPRLSLGAQSRLQVQVGGRYSLLSYEKSALDSDRAGGDIALLRELSSSSTVSLNGDYEDVNYDDDLRNVDFNRTESFVRYSARGGRTQLSVDAGVNRTAGDIEGESGFLGRAQLSRRISPYANATLSLGRELSDAGNDFQQLQNQPTVGVGTQSVQTVSGPFTSTSAVLGLAYERGRVGFGVSGSVFDEEFDDQPVSQTASDRRRSVFGVSARRELTPTVSLNVSAQRMREDYEINARDFNEVYATVALSWRVGASLTTLAQIERFDRNGRASGADYVENRISLRAGYNFGSRSQTGTVVPVQTGMFR